jgi:hypothetical protein
MPDARCRMPDAVFTKKILIVFGVWNPISAVWVAGRIWNPVSGI